MKRYRRQPIGTITSILASVLLVPSTLSAASRSEAQYQKDIQPILNEYCSDCHMDGARKGKVAFDEFKSPEERLAHRDLWWAALKNLRAGIMPPEKKPRPSPAELEKLEDWIKGDVFKSDPKNPDPGRVTIRRMNRVEYRNTIRDLMGIDFKVEEEFPPDDTGYGFDNIGDVLTVSPMLLEKYLEAAEVIVNEAVPTVTKVVQTIVVSGKEFRGSGDFQEDNPEGRNLGIRPAGGERALNISYYDAAAISHQVTAEKAGAYRLVLNLGVRGDFNFDPGKCRLVFKVDDREAWQQEFVWKDRVKYRFEIDEEWQPGEHLLTFELHPLTPPEERKTSVDMQIVSVEVQGPLAREQWVHPPNYDRFFFEDSPPANPAAQKKYAREVLRRFAIKAFRRPVDESTLSRLIAIAEEAYRQPERTFEEGVARGLVAVLASPRFVFRTEDEESSFWSFLRTGYPSVDEYALASRLSYFLWSTMPDDELFQLAERRELRDNLQAQVQRMLKDPRAEALVENFAGQWLQVRDVDTIRIDERVVLARDEGNEKELKREEEEFRARLEAFREQRRLEALQAQQREQAKADDAASEAEPQAQAERPRRPRPRPFFRRRSEPRVELTGPLRRAMKQETEMYFAHLMRADRSVLELLDSNYTFVNETLAKHYQIEGVEGNEMRRVELPEGHPRGGILTQGSVLLVTSNPTRTSPVKRGLFILENILGSPPPPPPADVPLLEDSEKGFQDREPTLKEVLELHRDKPLCSSCHSRMDPLGLALENFNALAMWREEERKQKIETAGKLITGESFADVREFKRVLTHERRTDFYRCLTEKLLTYALGRGLEYYDVQTVDQIVERLEKENGQFSALLMGIVESAPFQKRRGKSDLAEEAPESSQPRVQAKL